MDDHHQRHACWRDARTLPDLGVLMAAWLDGDLPSRPGYEPNIGPDPETLPLIPSLTVANRAGFVTTSSQPGLAACVDDIPIQQRAAVAGFADIPLTARLMASLSTADLLMIVHPSPGWITRRIGVAVTTVGGHPVTTFGDRLGRVRLAALYGGLHPTMRRALVDACQVAIIDPQWRRDDYLWPRLAAALTGRPDKLDHDGE